MAFLKNGNPHDFNTLVAGGFTPNLVAAYGNAESGHTYTEQFNLYHYSADYNHAVLKYYEACGCTIVKKKWLYDNDLLNVTFTRPTKSIDAGTWYRDTYRGGRIIRLSDVLVFLFVLLLAFIAFKVGRS